jgi:hypothetical protein
VTDRQDFDLRISRRRVLSWLGGLGIAALLPACADEDGSAGPTSSAASTSTAAGTGASGSGASCVLSPELTEGPFTWIWISCGAT